MNILISNPMSSKCYEIIWQGVLLFCELDPPQYKDGLSRYVDSYCKDKTVVGLSYLYNGNSYTDKISLYWDNTVGPILLTTFSYTSIGIRHGYFLSKVNTLRPRQNGRHFADDIFKGIFLNENFLIRIKFSLKFVPKGPINNIPALVRIMAWRRPGGT